MATSAPTTSRRAMLGILAAAPVALAIPAATPSQAQDWRSKPTEAWTRTDCREEARFQIAAARAALAHHPDSVVHRASLDWWEREQIGRAHV